MHVHRVPRPSYLKPPGPARRHAHPEADGQATHSERRGSDTGARRDREKTGSTEAEIDIYYGWHEKVLLKEMQVHYAAMSIKERMKQAKITSLM